jgi:hypothetical protein
VKAVERWEGTEEAVRERREGIVKFEDEETWWSPPVEPGAVVVDEEMRAPLRSKVNVVGREEVSEEEESGAEEGGGFGFIQSSAGLTGSFGKKCLRIYSGVPSSSSSSTCCCIGLVGGAAGFGRFEDGVGRVLGVGALPLPCNFFIARSCSILIIPSDNPISSLICLCSSRI